MFVCVDVFITCFFLCVSFNTCYMRCINKWKHKKLLWCTATSRKHVKATKRNLKCGFLINDLQFFFLFIFLRKFNNKMSKLKLKWRRRNWIWSIYSVWHTFATRKKTERIQLYVRPKTTNVTKFPLHNLHQYKSLIYIFHPE